MAPSSTSNADFNQNNHMEMKGKHQVKNSEILRKRNSEHD
jgi:hypothetical protein